MTNEKAHANIEELFSSDVLGVRVVMGTDETHMHAGVRPHLPELFDQVTQEDLVLSDSGAILICKEIDGYFPCYLVDVSAADEIRMGYRGDRHYLSPIAVNKGPDQSNKLTVVLIPDASGDKQTFILATTYIGEPTPLELNHPKLTDNLVGVEVKEEARSFWQNADGTWRHALAPEPGLSITYAHS